MSLSKLFTSIDFIFFPPYEMTRTREVKGRKHFAFIVEKKRKKKKRTKGRVGGTWSESVKVCSDHEAVKCTCAFWSCVCRAGMGKNIVFCQLRREELRTTCLITEEDQSSRKFMNYVTNS